MYSMYFTAVDYDDAHICKVAYDVDRRYSERS